MRKVSSYRQNITVPNRDKVWGHSSAVDALCQNGFTEAYGQFVPRKLGARFGNPYDVVERVSDSALFVVRGTNADGTICISRFNGKFRDLE